MSEQLQLRRGAGSQVASFVGAQGEVVVDTSNNRLVVQDGATAGGFAAAKLTEVFNVGEGAAISASTTIAAPGFYRITSVGVTVTLPSSWPFRTPIVLKDWTGSSSPNIIIAGTIDGSTNGSAIVAKNAAATFFWSPSASSWVQI
ncbi:MAG TPA: hypothetical protein VMI72_12690 [Roseiarcus sp.]|nr:hypothetical protein [Roseiarcus sp.]